MNKNGTNFFQTKLCTNEPTKGIIGEGIKDRRKGIKVAWLPLCRDVLFEERVEVQDEG